MYYIYTTGETSDEAYEYIRSIGYKTQPLTLIHSEPSSECDDEFPVHVFRVDAEINPYEGGVVAMLHEMFDLPNHPDGELVEI